MPFEKRAESRGIVSWAMSSSPQCVGWITRSAPAWRGRGNGNTKRKRRLAVPGWPENGAVSSDHLVGAGEHVGRDGHAQSLGRLEVHHHHELLDALRRHLCGPPALEDLVYEVRGASPHLEGVHLVTDEPARLGKRAVPDGGQALTHSEQGDAPRVGVEYRVRLDGHGLHPAPPHSREGALQPFGGARLEALYVH